MPKPPPKFRFLARNDASDGLTEIGQVWATSKADVFSVNIEINGERFNCMMMPNNPKPKSEPTKPKPDSRGNRRSVPGPRPAA
jgi:hypothetical protein